MKRLLISIIIATCLVCDADAARRWVPKIGAAAGPNTWYYGGSTPDTGYNISTNSIWINVTVGAGGTCTKLGLYIQTYYSTTTAKLALYSGLNPISGASGTVSITGTGWFDATITTPASVSAGTYQVCVVVDSGAAQIGGHGDTGITCYLQGEDYAAFPPAALVTNFASYSNQSWGLRMWVQ